MAFMAVVLIAVQASGSDEKSYPRFPWDFWSETTQHLTGNERTGLKLEGVFQQHADLYKIQNGPIISPFIGFKFKITNQELNWADRMVGARTGLNFKFPFCTNIATGVLNLGVRAEFNQYLFKDTKRPYSEDTRFLLVMQFSAKGDLKDL